MKNKNGKTHPAVWIVGVLAIVLVLYFTVGQNIGVNNGGSPGAVGCNIAPSVNVLATNTLVTGTTPSLSANYSIYDGSYVGSIPTSLSQGVSLDVLATATNYLNAESKLSSIGCGSNSLKFALTPYQIPTYTIIDANYNTLTDNVAGGAVNESSSANQITDTLKINGVPDKSTGDMLIAIEYANKTEVTSSDISMAGATRVATPSWYTVAGTGSSVAFFSVPAIVNGGSKTYDVTFTPESGKTIGAVGAGVYTTLYTLNPVILDSQTGTFQSSNTWSDSLGADKTIANVDYDFYIV